MDTESDLRGPKGAIALLAGLSLAASIQAQAPELQPVDAFDETVRVQVVNLEVVVTDETGERVAGLPKEAFLVRVDGVEVPVRYFSEIGPGPMGGLTGAEPSPVDSPELDLPPVNFLVFIDDHTTLKRNRDFTLEHLRRELPMIRPGDAMSVVAYDGRALEVLSPWTGEVDVLDASLLAAMARPTTGIRYVALARMTLFVANWIGNATRRGILAAASSLRVLPRPSGRKVMLLVAGSWDPRELRIAENFSPWCLAGPCSGTHVFSALTDTANQLGYSIYAVDVEGRDVHGSWWREMRLQRTLGMLASETGGRTLLNTDRRRMLSIAAEDSRTGYYSIGVEPRDLAPDSRHRIEVEVLRPGLEARSRGSFVALTERRHRDLETLGALLSDVDLGASVFPVEIGSRQRRKRGRMTVPISVFAPTGKLSWLESDGRHEVLFEVGLATVDVYGNSDVETHRVSLAGRRAARSGELEHLEFEIVRPRRRQTLAVVVRDLQGEAVFTSVVEIGRPGEDEAGSAADEAPASRSSGAPGLRSLRASSAD